MKNNDEASERITRMRTRYLSDVAHISIQRAKYYTESWRETEASDLSQNVRVAQAVRRVFERMDITIDPDDRIVGSWTEFFLGVPIDVEKGLFNRVFEVELGLWSMIRSIVGQNITFLAYMLRRYGLRALIGSITESSRVGAAMPSIGTTPMQKRRVNPCAISRKDKKLLLGGILPYWRGKTIAEELQRRITDERIYAGDMEMFAAALPATTSRKDIVISLGAAIGVWQGHLILDHETPIKKGLLSMQDEVWRVKDSLTNGDREAMEFLTSVDIALEGVITYARRLAEALKRELDRETDPERRRIIVGMLEACEWAPLRPARTFREAVQSYWTVKTAVESWRCPSMSTLRDGSTSTSSLITRRTSVRGASPGMRPGSFSRNCCSR
ncbi:MAG: hypothetical protein JW885_01375 [Deltaproteobacteria bacterium]|nr:hypothetical protein [Candidatus Zymogenaceae bacterium]